MRFAVLSLLGVSLMLAGCSSGYTAPTATPKPTPTPAPTPPAATPIFSLAAGTYTSAQMVTISDTTAGATIYYTTNGSAPTASANQYSGPITVSATETLMAAAIAPGYALSAAESASYTIAPPPPPAPPPTPPQTPSGTVRHGQVPIVGARVYLLAANTTGYGNVSVSLLESAATGASDSIGAYVATAADGSFAIEGDYACTANTQVYIYALGGDAGSGNSPASGLLAVLGNCPSSGSFSTATPNIVVNEVTTVAAAYAMAGFATDATHVSSSGSPLAQTGIANAFANAANLVDLATGAALTATPAGNGTVPQSEINTLANSLAACVGSTNAASCSTLFASATADGTASGAQPTDTATAAVNLAHHPGVNVEALYALSAASSVFTPVLTSQPNDFTVALCFTVPDEESDQSAALSGAHPIAIDGDGSVWVLGTDPVHSNNVFKLSSSGAFLSPPGGFTGGGLNNPASIAIDPSGNAWITNFTVSGAQSLVSISELSGNGDALSPSTGFMPSTPLLGFTIAIDGSGNVWLPYGSGVAEFSSSGSLVTAVPNPPGGTPEPIEGLALNANGNIWGVVTRFDFVAGGSPIAEFSQTGAAIVSLGVGQFSCGASPISDGGPQAMALDAAGNVWFTGGQGVTKESKSPIPDCSGTSGGIEAFIESTGGDIAIDGDGNVWVVSDATGPVDLSELANSGAPISPSSGYRARGAVPFGLALDGAGNLWATGTNFKTVGNFNSLNILEFIGASAPVVTPFAAGVKSNTVATRP
jgi:hypothetical protein